MKINKLNLFFICLMLQVTSWLNAADNAPTQTPQEFDPTKFFVIVTHPFVTTGNLLIPVVTEAQASTIHTQDNLDEIRAQQIAQLEELRRTYIVIPNERTTPTQPQ